MVMLLALEKNQRHSAYIYLEVGNPYPGNPMTGASPGSFTLPRTVIRTAMFVSRYCVGIYISYTLYGWNWLLQWHMTDSVLDWLYVYTPRHCASDLGPRNLKRSYHRSVYPRGEKK